MQSRRFFFLLSLGFIFAFGTIARGEGFASSSTRFYYQNQSGRIHSARIVRRYFIRKIHPPAQVDNRIDPRLRRAATIADERANAHTKARCWRYVKQALVSAGVVGSYPSTNYACQAGQELVSKYGFRKLPIRDPYAAPEGAVIVYGKGANGAGHVEFRTRTGFASDYHSKNRCYYPVLAVYAKFSS